MPRRLGVWWVFLTVGALSCGGGGGADSPELTLTISGNGRVISEPAGLDCDSSCTASFTRDGSVVLRATPGEGQYFAGWSGACSGDGETCTLTIAGDLAVQASFGQGVALHLVIEGDGRGVIRFPVRDRECRDDCTTPLKPGTPVALSAAADDGSTFAGFTGDCTTSKSTCALVVDGERTVHARFVGPGGLVWAKRFGRETTDRGFGTTVDRAGDVVATGYFDSPQADFGGGPLTNHGGDDIVVAKYRGLDGSYLWSQSFGGPLDDRSLATAVDESGDVYITGYFQDTVAFGDTRLSSRGARDVFIAKLGGSDGHVLWAKGYGTPKSDQGMGVAVGSNDRPVLTGFFLGDLELGNTKLRGNGNRDILVAELDPASGDPVWSRSFGGEGDDQGLGISTAANGDVLLTGFFEGRVDLGGRELSSHGSQDLYVSRLAAGDGAPLWATSFGGGGVDQGLDIVPTPDGHLIVTGYFQGTEDFGTTRLVSAGAEDAVAIELDGGNGAAVWARRFGSASSDQGLGVAVEAGGDAIVTGFFNGSADFGTGVLSSAGGQDIFVVRLRGNDGSTEWAHTFGGSGEDFGLAVAIDASGFSFVTGWFFDATQVGGEPLDTPILRDLIVFRLGP